MIAFRESAVDDVLSLRRRCFPEDDFDKPRAARMFVAEDEGRPVAALGFIEQTYVIDGNEYAGALAIDAMTDPAYRRQGLFRRVAEFARDAIRDTYALSTAWQIRPAVLSAIAAAGWEPILRAPVFVKLLLKGGDAVTFESGGGAAALLNCAHVQRDPDRLAAPYYTHTETCTTRETTLRGHRTLAILDLNAKPKLPATDARIAAALMTWRHPLLPALLRSGFLPSPYRFRFLVNVFDARIDAKRARWALTWADTDHL